MCDGLDKLREELKRIDERFKDKVEKRKQKELLRKQQKDSPK